MKKVISIASFLLFFAISLQAQQGQVIVTLQQPPPNQLNIANLWKLTINNLSQNTMQAFLFGTVDEETDGRILEAKSQTFSISPGFKMYTANDFSSADIKYNNNRYKEIIFRTGNAPSGNYTICIYLKTENGEDVNNNCITQIISTVSPPILISPQDDDTLSTKSPIFSWTPPVPLSPNMRVTYKLQIAEISNNQLPEEAFNNNLPFYSKDDISTNVFQFAVSATSFSNGKSYAWRISATSNNSIIGKSEIWKFSIKGDLISVLLTSTCQEKIIKKFIKTYESIYNIKTMEGDAVTGPDGGYFGYQRFFSAGYWGCIELHGNCDQGSLWIGLPKIHFISWEEGAGEFTKWFEYSYKKSGSSYDFKFIPTADMPSPPYPNLDMAGEEGRKDIRPKEDGAWANFIDYDPVAVACDKLESLPGSMDIGTCIPHYSHILVPSGPKISDIHSNYQNPGAFAITQKMLEDAKPPACYDLPGKKEVEEILWITCPPELRVIGWIAGKDLCKKIAKKIVDYTFRICPELKKRNALGWQTATLRGFVERAEDPENDLAMDHISKCYSSGLEPTGPVIPPAAYPPSPFNDWDMKITPDYDVRYLGSDVKPEIVGIELEKWLVPYKYQPVKGDYLQSMGRWVIDCGHPQDDDVNDGFYTEIHPPELLVSSNQVGDGAITEARVMVNGSWKGDNLKFLVWPIPRPNSKSILKDTIVVERLDLCKIEVKRVPADNPNHLECTIKNTGSASPKIDSRGFILYNCYRGIQAVIQAWWEAPPSLVYTKKPLIPDMGFEIEGTSKYMGKLSDKDKDSKTGYLKISPDRLNSILANNFSFNLSGKFDCAGMSDGDCYLFYRNTGENSSGWQSLKLDEEGRFSINAVYGEKYDLIPSSLKYRFTNSYVQVTIDSNYTRVNSKNKNVEFKGLLRSEFSNLEFVPGVKGLYDPPFYSPFDYQKDPALKEKLLEQIKDPNLLTEFERQFKERFVTVMQPDEIETDNENINITENNGAVFMHLSSLVDSNNTPIRFMSACLMAHNNSFGVKVPISLRGDSLHPFLAFPLSQYLQENSEDKGNLLIYALKGSGTPEALIKARLLLGNESSGFRLINETTGRTDSEGNIKFNFTTGDNFGSGKIVIEVIENPSNPWFLPKVECETFVFPPLAIFNGQGQNGINFSSFKIEQKPILYQNIQAVFANKTNTENLTIDERMDREFLQEMAEVYESDLWENLSLFILRHPDNFLSNENTIVNQ